MKLGRVFFMLCCALFLSSCGSQMKASSMSIDGAIFPPTLLSLTVANNLTTQGEDVEAVSDDDQHTVAEICAGFRENYDAWKDDYVSPYTFWVTVNGKNYYYRRCYSETEWTPEAVADDFCEHPYAWGKDPLEPYTQVTRYYLWDSSYEHEFLADTTANWLYIDGIKAYPLEREASSMRPQDLVAAFQSREWDGVTPKYSEDFTTSVVVNPDYGLLEYEFNMDRYSEKKDPNGFAYTAYLDAKPWWINFDYEVVTMNDGRYSLSGVIDPHYFECSEGIFADAWAIAYVDVPWESQSRLWAVQHAGEVYHYGYHPGDYAMHTLYAQRTSDGLYALTDDGVELWRAGRLRQKWNLKVSDDSYLLTDFYYSNDRIFVYADGKFMELYDDGTREVIIDHIISVNVRYATGFGCGCFTLSDNRELSLCGLSSYSNKNETESRMLAENVVAADLTDDSLLLYTDITGRTYAIHGFYHGDSGIMSLLWTADYKIDCLGEGDIEYFKALYDAYRLERGDDFVYEEFIEEMSESYAQESAGNEIELG